MDNEELIQTLRGVVSEVVEDRIRTLLSERLLAPSEAVKLFQPAISKLTLQKWTDKNLIPVTRLGGRLFYKRDDILNLGSNHKKYDRQ